MPSLIRIFILVASSGLLFVAMSGELSTHLMAVLQGLGQVQGNVSPECGNTGSGAAADPIRNRLSPDGDKGLLAKTATTSKKKG